MEMNKLMQYKKDELNYSRICKGKIYSYSVCEDGTIIKTSLKRYKESNVKPYLKDGKATVKINGKEYILKHLVAKHFKKRHDDDNVINIDGNPFNCSVDNLKVISKRDLGFQTGYMSRSREVIANGIKYRSVRECAKALFVSYQTLFDYLSGKVRHSVLQGLDIWYLK